jgi:hypothetical protein
MQYFLYFFFIFFYYPGKLAYLEHQIMRYSKLFPCIFGYIGIEKD